MSPCENDTPINWKRNLIVAWLGCFLTGAAFSLVMPFLPLYVCLLYTSILKRNIHQQALRELVASGFNRVFLGTDSAPHARHRKESSCGCAGCFNAPTALGSYATVFEEMNALQHFEAFCSVNGPQFYGLPVNDTFIELVREEQQVAESIALTDDTPVSYTHLRGD